MHRVWVVWAVALAMVGSPPRPGRARAAAQTVHILLLYGLSPEAPTVSVFTHRLRRTVREEMAAPVEFYEEYLDLDRFPGRTQQLARYFAEKYRGVRIDAIIAIGSNALRFATGRLRVFPPHVPVVFALTIENGLDAESLPRNVTGRWMRIDYAAILSMARRLQPYAERVAIIGGFSAIDSVAVSAAMKAAAQHNKLDILLLQGLAYDSLVARVRHLPPRTIVLLAYFRRDQRGQLFIPGEVISTISSAASAPVYGYALTWVGEGIVGGAVINHDNEGLQTAHLLMSVLRLPSGAPLPAPVAAGATYVVDWREMQRWGLSEEDLPPHTEILYRSPSVWERYRGPILASLGLIIGQSMLIALLLVERQRRRRAQYAVQDQNAYEQTIADLTTDAVRHAPEEAPRALEDALARVARYAGASKAVLVQYAEGSDRGPTTLCWPHSEAVFRGMAGPSLSRNGDADDVALQIPLEADGTPIGRLDLYRDDVEQEWAPRLVSRLGAAGELIASAMARARAARAVRRGEQLNRAVLASLSTQIAILDANGTIIRVNDAWRQVAYTAGVSVDRDAFLGQNYLDECLRSEDRGCREAGEVRRGIEAVLDRGVWHFRHEYNCSSPDSRWYELRVDRLEHEDGGAIITHIDITDRRLAERRAEETRRQIAHLGRVAMVGELAAAVSHELRQPLAAIRANAEAGYLLLEKTQPDVRESMQIFRDIVDDNRRASDIIDHIRILLRKDEPPKSNSVDLNEICRQAVHLLKRDALLRGTRLELALESQLAPIAGDPIQLQQVVLNLALNALDSASASAQDGAVTVSTAIHGGEVEIAVRDTGPGLPPNVEQHLFESFFSTKAQGLGMGLVIVRSIVERHHGRVRAENDASRGGGAVFRVLLPIS